MPEKRSAIYIRCTPEEAQKIREAARAERRTISGFLLNAARGRLEIRQKMQADLAQRQGAEKKPQT